MQPMHARLSRPAGEPLMPIFKVEMRAEVQHRAFVYVGAKDALEAKEKADFVDSPEWVEDDNTWERLDSDLYEATPVAFIPEDYDQTDHVFDEQGWKKKKESEQ